MIELTYDQAVAELQKAVELKGADHVVQCSIFDNGLPNGKKVPMCIVGQVIYQLVGDEVFQNVKAGYVTGPLESVGITADGRATILLTEVQAYQDGAVQPTNYEGSDWEMYGESQPWGDAVEYALKEATR